MWHSMPARCFLTLMIACVALIGCGDRTPDRERVLRQLAQSSDAQLAEGSREPQEKLIRAPSDKEARYFLIKSRARLLHGTRIAVIRKELAEKVGYGRIEVDCAERSMRVLALSDRRSFVEAGLSRPVELSSIADRPLRRELAAAVCAKDGV
ncbi:MAG: hypothetical protein EOP66_00330 [Sphingomonas sp.]|nr:MAG: hypothetical protein EOP66_00330 [Sphingomonas sp.]